MRDKILSLAFAFLIDIAEHTTRIVQGLRDNAVPHAAAIGGRNINEPARCETIGRAEPRPVIIVTTTGAITGRFLTILAIV
jgi:hypothetical protein